MANISTYLAAILSAVYGEDVRGSIHDAIEIINEVGEVVFSTGTDITSASSSSTGYYDKSLYLNTDTYELWKCIGTDTWQSLGVLKGNTGVGISSIQKTSTAGLVDTYTITYTDGNTDTFTVTNGADGADGADGNHIYRGTDISGKAVLPTVYPSSGITDANADDLYLNPSEGAIYSCVTGGDASTATWQYEFTMTGGGGSSYSAGTGIDIDAHDVISVDPGTIASGENKPPKAGDVFDELAKKVDIDQGVAHAGEYLKVGSDGKVTTAAGGGGLLPHLYIDSEAGSTVTVTCPDSSTITPTAAGAGHWECDVPSYGTYVIHSVLSGQGDATVSLTVDDVKEYHVTDNHYDHTINVTAPNGATIRVTNGTETYTGTGTGSSQAFVVHTASSTYTVSATLDGNTKSDTVTSSATTGQSSSVTIDFGTITVTVDADFVTAGASISCVSGGTSCTAKTAASTLTFRPPSTGTWTISGTISGKTYTVDATVSSLSTAVSVSLKTKALMYSFETCTDQQLADMLESYYNGAYDATDIATLKSTYMPIGAKRSISLSAMSATGVSESHHADSYQFTIIGHEHDNLKTTSSGGKTKALLTLQTDRILYKNTTDATYSSNYPSVADEGGYMEPTNTNVNGWKNCPRRTWCNDVFLAALPAAIKSLVKTVNKLTSAGNQSATIDTTEDDVFLLSEIEIFGTVTNSKAGEGSQYEYYQTASNICKKPSYTSYASAYWWERSPYASSAAYFCYVSENGATNYTDASLALGLAPAFCI